jgi:hypothetical protein
MATNLKKIDSFFLSFILEQQQEDERPHEVNCQLIQCKKAPPQSKP